VKLGWRARFPHYKRHLEPILNLARQLGHEIVDGDADATIVAGIPDVASVRGASKVVLLEHGAGQTYRQGNRTVGPSGDTRTEPKVTLYLASTQHIADHMAAKLPRADRVVVGSPAVERLYWKRWNKNPDKVTFAVHWASPIRVPEAGTSWPWSLTILRKLLDSHDVLVHAHPRIAYRVQRDLRRRRIEVEWEADWDTAAVQTKTLVCDNSSIIWEADAVGIPVVLIDPPYWNPNAAHGLRWGPEAAGFARTTGNDLTAVTTAQPQNVGLYGRLDGSTRRAVDAIVEHVDSCPSYPPDHQRNDSHLPDRRNRRRIPG